MGLQKFVKKKLFDDESPLVKTDSKKISKKGKKMFLQLRADNFRCKHCKKEVPLESTSTKHRNHCPYCLYSLHVDVSPGDRKSECYGSMKPIGICLKIDGGEVMIIHDCQKCGK
jgi:DNA-directed RNA polymerase subunit RPC12/RpoP